jgi:ubiquinone/menaquinone biosynthesis C-methylase UbiE
MHTISTRKRKDNMSTDYDDIAFEYKIINSQLPVKKYAEEFNFLNLLGDVKGRTVLDLACGEGRFTRKIKQRGARHVVGVDISQKMIELARSAEKENPLSVEYISCDVTELGRIGSFDIVTASFLFNYATSKEALLAMCQTAYVNLKNGGKLVAMVNATPLYQPRDSNVTQKYGYLIISASPLHEGDSVEYLFFMDEYSFSITNYHWSKETYDWALFKSKFSKITWHPPTISQKGIEEYGIEFWRDFLDQPNFVCVECCKFDKFYRSKVIISF